MRYEDIIETIQRRKERAYPSDESTYADSGNIEREGTRYLQLVKPTRFSDAEDIVDRMTNKQRLILNLEQLETEDMRRLMDYVGGAVQALQYSLQRFFGDTLSP